MDSVQSIQHVSVVETRESNLKLQKSVWKISPHINKTVYITLYSKIVKNLTMLGVWKKHNGSELERQFKIPNFQMSLTDSMRGKKGLYFLYAVHNLFMKSLPEAASRNYSL